VFDIVMPKKKLEKCLERKFQVFLCPERQSPKCGRQIPSADPFKEIGFSPGMELFDMVNSPPVPQLDSPVAPTGHRPISSQVSYIFKF